MDKWQPIETAPKDGTPILISRIGSDFVDIAHWEVEPGWAWHGAAPCWACHMTDDDYYSFYLPAEWPTHYMPLPAPPK